MPKYEIGWGTGKIFRGIAGKKNIAGDNDDTKEGANEYSAQFRRHGGRRRERKNNHSSLHVYSRSPYRGSSVGDHCLGITTKHQLKFALIGDIVVTSHTAIGS